MKMKLVILCFVLNPLLTGAMWSPSSPRHQQLIMKEGHRGLEFQQEGGLFCKLENKLSSALSKMKNVVFATAKQVSNEARSLEGMLKDSVDKVEHWDVVDSPKRIGEDIERNVSRKVEEVKEELKEEVKKTENKVTETGLDEPLRKSMKVIHDELVTTVNWLYLLGFTTAYGMGMWVTFISSCVLGKCLPKQHSEMVGKKMKIVYYKAMAYCIGASLFWYVISQLKKGVFPNKMEMFQGFNLLSALFMMFINFIFLEPQTTKMESIERKRILVEKVKKYSSTMNIWTLVVLSWHMAYIGRLLHVRR